ncbi:hypothetical protein ACX0G7_17490 [Flavitalea antarctica]
MKKLYFTLLLLISSATIFSQTYYQYTAQKNGNWNDLTVWAMAIRTDGVPKTKVIIPASYAVTVDNGVNSFGLGVADINIIGSLTMVNNTNINLASGSTIELFGSGSIVGGNATQLITLGGVIKYNGSKDHTKTGGWLANSTTGVSPSGFVSTLVLPVKMLSFNITRDINGTRLKWVTASEVSNDYFSVERSADGLAWIAIGTVKGASSSTTSNTYSFIDKNDNAATTYYRLKQVDNRGSFSYSGIRKISTGVENTTKVYLLNNIIRVELANASDEKTVVTVMQAGGSVLARRSFSDAKTISLDLHPGSAGIVLVNVSDNKQLNKTVKLINH